MVCLNMARQAMVPMHLFTISILDKDYQVYKPYYEQEHMAI